VADIWTGLYSLGCDVNIEQGAGGSSAGANRVCGNHEAGESIDIGNMSRDWKESEASPRDGSFVHDCLIGDAHKSSVQIDVALDGMAVVVPRNGAGYSCVQILGGLTRDQLRWIYSSYDEVRLVNTGWDQSSLKNSDGNPATHLWSELDDRCDPEEIILTGGPIGDGSFTEFVQFVLTDVANGESIDVDRPAGYRHGQGFELLTEILKDENAITFLGYHYFYEKTDLVWAAPLQNATGSFVGPNEASISGGSYPLTRTLFMNVLNDEKSLQNTIPLLRFGLDHPETIRSVGYVPLHDSSLGEMILRLHGAPYKDDTIRLGEDGNKGFSFSWKIVLGTLSGLVILVFSFAVCVYVYVYVYYGRSTKAM